MYQKATGRAMSMPAGVSVGMAVSLVITLVGAFVLGWLINQETLAINSVGYGAMVILLAASFLGALTAKVRIKHRYLVVCLLTGVGYYLVLLGITAMFFGGQYRGMGVTLALVLAGSGAAGLLSIKKKKSITKGYRKLRTV
jgi:putative membrane protein (TIGR04086 family)